MPGTDDPDDPDGQDGELPGERSTPGPELSRRGVLRALPAPALATTLAGCGGIGGGDDARTDLTPGETTDFAAAIAFDDRYEVTTEVEGGTTVTGRFDGEDRSVRVETGDRVVTFVVVDGDGYLVNDGDCVRYPDVTATVGENRAAVADRAVDVEPPTLRVDRTTRLGDREVWVLELTEESEGAASYYVDVATNRMRRVEAGDTVVDYRSWGNVDPVAPPAEDCRTVEPASRSLVPNGPSI